MRGTRLIRPPFAAALEGTRKSKGAGSPLPRGRRNLVHLVFASAAGTAALCSSRAPLGRGEQAEEIAACTARGRAQDARESDVSTGMYCQRTPEPAREVCRAWMPGKPRPRGCPFLWLLSFGQAKESHSAARMADEKTHGRESVIATSPQRHARLALTLPSPASGRGKETRASTWKRGP